MTRVEIIAYHGWGFDRACWKDWNDCAIEQGYDLQCFDRGYFGHPFEPEFMTESSVRVLVAHSYGLHLCSLETLRRVDVLMIVGGFREFHPLEGRERKRSQRVLAEMLRQFEQTPHQVLNDFMENCFYPDRNSQSNSFTESSQLNSKLLIDDLKMLSQSSLPIENIQSIPAIVILHGAHDRIVSPQQSKDLLSLLPNAEFFLVESTGHALPFTHASLCFSRLRSRIYSSPKSFAR